MSNKNPRDYDLELFLAQLPMVHEDDCSVDFDALTMAGLNHVARAQTMSVDDVAINACRFWLKLYFSEQSIPEEGE